MQALVFDGRQLAFTTDHPDPVPPAGEALIQVLLAGICATDREILRGYAGFRGIPGHEFVGRVIACPDRPHMVGWRVVGEINVGCGGCARCQSGVPEHCAGRTALGIRGRNGAFAGFLSLPAANLHAVPDSVPDEAAVFVEPLAAALQIPQQIAVQPADRVVVLGPGKLGQLVARVLALSGCDLVVVGRDRSRPGVDLLRAQQIDFALMDDLPKHAADVVVDCTGGPDGFGLALSLLRPRGTLVLKSTYAGSPRLDMSQVAVDEIRIVGSRCGPFEPALRLLEQGLVDPLPMVDATYRLEDGLRAFEHAGQPGALKVLLRP